MRNFLYNCLITFILILIGLLIIDILGWVFIINSIFIVGAALLVVKLIELRDKK
jgi:hypothetical protein